MVVIVFEKRKVRRRRIMQPKNPACRYIPLTKGQKALVDAEDYDWLMGWNWSAKWDEGSQSYYARRRVQKIEGLGVASVGMHNVVKGLFGGIIVDHRNGDTLDNRKGNLRRASSQQNTFNHPTRKDNQLGVKGVRRQGNRFEVRICLDGKRTSKMFATVDEAVQWRDAAAREMHGEFIRTVA